MKLAVVTKVMGRTGSRGQVTQVRVKLMDGSERHVRLLNSPSQISLRCSCIPASCLTDWFHSYCAPSFQLQIMRNVKGPVRQGDYHFDRLPRISFPSFVGCTVQGSAECVACLYNADDIITLMESEREAKRLK